MSNENPNRNNTVELTNKASGNRRQFVKTLGAVGVGAFALGSGIPVAAAKRPEDIHPDDKLTISKDRYKTKGSDYRELVKNSKLFKARALGKDEVLIYVNRPFARKHLLDGTETAPEDASISAQIASTDEGRELAARFEAMNEQIDADVDESIRSYRPSGFTTQDAETVQLGDSRTLDVVFGQKDSGYFGIFGNREVTVADQGFIYSKAFIAPGAVGDAGCRMLGVGW